MQHHRLDVGKLQEAFQGLHGNLFLKCRDKDAYGTEGEYYVGPLLVSQEVGAVVSDEAPSTQPSSWCHWIVKHTRLLWDGEEYFENPVEWLQYVIKHFLAPWGVAVNGAVQWQGFDIPYNRGTISVWCNKIHSHNDIIDSDSDSDMEE